MNPIVFTDEQVDLIKLILSERIVRINECVNDNDYNPISELPEVLKEKSDLQEIVNILK